MLSRVRGLLRAVPVLRRQRQPDPRAPGHLRPGRVLLRVRLLPLRQVNRSLVMFSILVFNFILNKFSSLILSHSPINFNPQPILEYGWQK